MKRYNGLPDTERMALLALRLKLEVLALTKPTEVHTPESVLREVTNAAELSRKDCLNDKQILSAFYRGR